MYFLTFFFFNDPATSEIYTLSLHDALPICRPKHGYDSTTLVRDLIAVLDSLRLEYRDQIAHERSEEHTSELQSLTNLVCRLLLEKKKKKKKITRKNTRQ